MTAAFFIYLVAKDVRKDTGDAMGEMSIMLPPGTSVGQYSSSEYGEIVRLSLPGGEKFLLPVVKSRFDYLMKQALLNKDPYIEVEETFASLRTQSSRPDFGAARQCSR